MNTRRESIELGKPREEFKWEVIISNTKCSAKSWKRRTLEKSRLRSPVMVGLREQFW